MTDRSKSPVWFAAKRVGFGSSLPIAWQGWLVYAAFLGVVTGTALLPPGHHALRIVVIAIAVLSLVVVTQRHTESGWKWRWGNRSR